MKFYILVIFCIGKVWAAPLVYKLNNRHYNVVQKRGITATPSCFSEKSCTAFREAKKLKGKAIPYSNDSKNPLAILCKENLKGELIVGRNQKGEEDSFCRFPDSSVISSGSLREFI